jgi:UDPglucose--hexose-1-phosphate uridylyltransferase
MAPDHWQNTQHPHRRYNPLRSEWVLVSPQRNQRPWQGDVAAPIAEPTTAYDRGCYLCPGNRRAGGAVNPSYTSTFVFDNDYAALTPAAGADIAAPPGASHADLVVALPARGLCRVVCFSPRHDLTLARMDAPSLRGVIETWIDECESIAETDWARYVLVFENRGAMMGASNPHPHGQIWATDDVPNEPARERESFARHEREHGACLLCRYLQVETALTERIVCGNDAFVAIVPFWAAWPFETIVISRRHLATLAALEAAERDALADLLKRLTTRYDNVFAAPFPYSMGFHQQPLREPQASPAHLHAHFYPPLLRSATIRKFMVGFELLGSPQRDLTPEEAAGRLREAGDIHYRSLVLGS